MARDLALTFSCGDDEIVRALEEGIVKPQGIDLEVVVMDSLARYAIVRAWPGARSRSTNCSPRGRDGI